MSHDTSRGRVWRQVAAASLGVLCSSSPAVADQKPGSALGPVSPRIARLAQKISAGERDAVAAFWSEVASQGAPLVEDVPGSAQTCLVTFLWRSEPETNVLVLTDFGDYVQHMQLRRLANSDVWYHSHELPRDAIFLYEFAVDDPAFPFVDGATVRYPDRVRPDPLNARQYDYSKPHVLSLLALPDARAPRKPEPPAETRGLVSKLGDGIASTILGDRRKILVYRPPGYTDSGPPYPLLVFPASYINQVRLPAILEDLIARRAIRPVVAIFTELKPATQDAEAGCDPKYADFVATELVPWVRERLHVTAEPGETSIGGASAGGLAAAYIAFRHPEVFGQVLSQSGAFWRGVGGTAAHWNDPRNDAGREGFTRLLATSPAVPVRFYLTIGVLERGTAFSADAPSMMAVNRHLRDVLEAKGYRVDLREVPGGHDPFNWEAGLPDALVALVGAP